MKNILSCKQFDRYYLANLFNQVKVIKENPISFRNALDGKILAVLFYEPSTRTRFSFESAILRLGGKYISTENAQEMSSAVKGESLIDTIRVISGYCDGIILRHFSSDAANLAAEYGSVPIINGGSGDGEHPTQALLDAYTIEEKMGTLDNLTIGILGDLRYGRTVHSLIRLLSLYNNVTIYGCSHSSLGLPQKYIDELTHKKVRYIPCSQIENISKTVNILYHTRTQIERFSADERIEEIVLNNEKMTAFSSETYILHPLPRRSELDTDLDSDNRNIVFEQAHNGLYVRMGLLLDVFSK